MMETKYWIHHTKAGGNPKLHGPFDDDEKLVIALVDLIRATPQLQSDEGEDTVTELRLINGTLYAYEFGHLFLETLRQEYLHA